MTTTMRIVETATMSDYDARIVEISVAGVCHQNVRRVSNYTMKVPHNRMSQAMREINTLGGKITGVHVLEQKSEATVTEEPKATKASAKRASKSTTTSKRSAPSKRTTTPKRTRRKKED